MVPGKIMELKGNMATVDYGSEQRSAQIITGEYAVGDYVLVMGGMVIQKVPSHEAIAALENYRKAVSKDGGGSEPPVDVVK
ncbi:TPA: HypC/HybG/HupF family hydrogenase formation chaperone [Candidatus Woesearchaeota archaeon]|nr:HypC/HybG/HupF family hydrogenase formation chaperone [Candidatus Woesearchaeota archaeon]HII69538.1 HypC/HybG/HupF family hydrogenase formation chaperone [Candidatus Woesearchaeota archaeon]